MRAVLLAAVALTHPAAARAVPPSLVGCWAHRAPALSVGTPAGVWLVKITKQGMLYAYPPPLRTCGTVFDFAMTISAASGRLRFGTAPVCPTGAGYSWALAGRSLSLHAKGDPCRWGAQLFAGVWTRR